MSEEIREKIKKQVKRLKEVIETCSLFMSGKTKVYDECNGLCPGYNFCWELQDLDEKTVHNANVVFVEESLT